MHSYRRDIDGLRAFAIIPVVLFHFGIPGMEGGFTGVDVFFVISGFLISSAIDRELQTGSWSLALFYERRARRLFPALYVMLMVCAIAASRLLMPLDYERFSTAFVYAAGFSGNFLFWKTTDYFDGPGDRQPLLHTWSLAVEEQFYIVFPLLMLAAYKWLPRRALPKLLIVCACASFYAAYRVAESDHSMAFYLPYFRAWELFLGALVALSAPPVVQSRTARELLAAIGLALIVLSATAFSEDSITPFPVPLLACVGTALLLHIGSTHSTVASRVLSWRPVVFIGLISYSLYLWHWPLWVFVGELSFSKLTLLEQLGLILASLVLATLSWRFVERPFRGTSGIGTRKQVLVVSALVIAATLAFAPRLLALAARQIPEDVRAIAAVGDELQRYRKCSDTKRALSKNCRLGRNKGKPTFLLWGDSHGMAIAEALDTLAKRERKAGVAFVRSACPPLVGVECDRTRGNHCAAYNAQVLKLLASNESIDTVFLAARWAMYTDGIPLRHGGTAEVTLTDKKKQVTGNHRVFAAGLERTLSALQQRHIRVVVVPQAPELDWDVPTQLARATFVGREAPPGTSRKRYAARQRAVTTTFATLRNAHRFETLDIAALLCRDDRCIVQHDGAPLYRDDNHLSQAGALWLLSTLNPFR